MSPQITRVGDAEMVTTLEIHAERREVVVKSSRKVTSPVRV